MLTIKPYMFAVAPVNLSERSPYEVQTLQGLPPGFREIAPVVYINGVPTIHGIPLGTPQSMNGQPSGNLSANAAANDAAQGVAGSQATYDRGAYGDAVIFPLTFAGAGLGVIGGTSVILPRPNNTRTELLIVNSTVAGQIFYNFDKDADAVSGVPIAQNGNRLWDTTVPQGNLSIFSSGAGIVIIEYINLNVTA